ncbi:superoxide dismutase [Aphanothece hegewaldii CCALA 016]|uniref:Superoxide dismutase n=1 Tax=Aphanothece hegewaldii CCALA 016 TaxID=2107694 RepID=A0A2T1LZ66_9CHRO|nr:superoxide dismutase [Aphanothece hegewaldii]PSF37668.1 superoxide dismutase [Aphanothece hegewaldii CCALA 016]
MAINRRHFLMLCGTLTAATAIEGLSNPTFAQTTETQSEPFKLPPLPYAYNALLPYIDEETMRFHHDKHHAAYTKNLNEAINKYPELKSKSINQLLSNLDTIPTDIRQTVRNNGGGYLNHKIFWEIMSPNGGGTPKGEIAQAIQKDFGSFEAFQTTFTDMGAKVFGSGWVWLVLDKSNKLKVMNLPNQDSPIMQGFSPIMGNDVWEHAYYLKYRNNRGEYLKQWWNVVNWEEVNRRFQSKKA